MASTRAAIKEARKQGVLCGVATGRGPVELEKVIDYLDLDMFITYNGQFVYTKQNLIYAKPFSKNILEEIVAYADENYRQVMFGGETKVAGSLTIRLSQSPVMQRYLRFVPKKFPVGVLKIAAAIQSKSKCQTVSVSGYFAGTNLSVHYAESRIRERKAKAKLPSCDFKRSNAYSVDIVPKKGSKMKGIHEFWLMKDRDRGSHGFWGSRK